MFLAMKVFQAKKFSSLFKMTIVTVIKDSANGYFLSFVVEVLPEVLPKTDNSVGIDLGIKTKASCREVLLRDMKPILFYTISLHGQKIDVPKLLKKRMLEVPKTK